MVRAASQYRYVSEPGLKVEPMIGAANRAARVLLKAPFEMTPDLTQALQEFVEAKSTPKHIVELKALKSANSQLASWSASHGVETAGIELIKLVWQYLGLHYEWMAHAERSKPVGSEEAR